LKADQAVFIIPCVAEDYYSTTFFQVAAAADVLKLTTRDVCAATGRPSKVEFREILYVNGMN